MTKPELYRKIAAKRIELSVSGVPVYAPDIVRECCPDIVLREKDFSTRSFGGILLIGPVSILCLNSRRSALEQNFDCAHELMHYWFGGRSISTDGSGLHIPKQDAYTEWVANEGAAELLMPYRRVVPLFYHERVWRLRNCARMERLRLLAAKFMVTPAQMEVRMQSLEGELRQYAEHLSGSKVIPAARRQTR